MKEIAGMIIQSNEIMANRVATVVSGNDVDVNGKRKKSFLDYLKYICVAIGFASLLIIAINNLLELLGWKEIKSPFFGLVIQTWWRAFFS